MSTIKAGKNPNTQRILTNGNAKKTKQELYADFLRAKLRLEAKLLNRTAIENEPPTQHKIHSKLFMHACSYVQLNFVFLNCLRFIHSSIHHTLAHILY